MASHPNSIPVLNPASKKPEINPPTQKNINICSWNIRRGLIIRELELREMIKKSSVNIIFLVETDTVAVNDESDYKIQGFKTLVQTKKNNTLPTRIICLIDEDLVNQIIIRTDLTSVDFPSLWVEIENMGKNILCGGFYREWAPNGDKTIEAQVKAMQTFTKQIESASTGGKSVIILGDANLCALRWDSPNFLHKRISEELRDTVTQCGMQLLDLGITYTADRLGAAGDEITSAIDHIYVTNELCQKLTFSKLDNSATDHVPILVCIDIATRKKQKPLPNQSVTKRSMKNFTRTRWIDCLRSRDWSQIKSKSDVNEKATAFTIEVNKALDECAPFKKFKIRQNFKPGLSEEAKRIMKERDLTRKSINKACTNEKPLLQAKYKQLRNRAITQIRNDTVQRNGERISEAKNEGETWRVVNEIIKPKSVNNIIINTQEGESSDEQSVAETLNKFFVEKIRKLKETVDQNLVRDPLERIRDKMKDKNLSLKLKTTTTAGVKKLMKQMAKKKSKGNDGIPQDCLLTGVEVLAEPMAEIINSSIESGVVPDQWKEAVVVPILKKGDPKEPKNYRPVSCLSAASKILEKAVCEQLTRFVEVHDLLPNNQHGFRSHRSTMTALTSMQMEWVKNTEEGLMTGVLVWDLSAAFDTLDIELFLQKLTIYGADSITLSWFRSFLTDRTQRVRVGNAISSPLTLVSGVPQGGILSPMIFTIYTADMEIWLKTSKVFNYADDTTTDNKSKYPEDIKSRLEEDALNVLSFMASNGLVANQAKTEFLVLNEKANSNVNLSQIKVGGFTVTRTTHTKLLGIIIEESQEWSNHFKILQSSLNSRLFIIRRLKNQIPSNKIISIVHSLWMSKLRYGLQLCTKVRLTENDPTSTDLKSLQLTQNRMLRVIINCKIKDKISIKSMLEKCGLLSVNQLAASIKLVEVWKSLNREGYPIRLEPYNHNLPNQTHNLRPKPNRTLNDYCRLRKFESSFAIDAARIWNAAPKEITCASSLNSAKNAVRLYCKSLPV